VLAPELELIAKLPNSKTVYDRKDSDLITAMPSVYHQAPWIEVEAKHKEEAIAYLRSWWLLENNF